MSTLAQPQGRQWGTVGTFTGLALLALACWPVFHIDEVYGMALFLGLLPLISLLIPSPVGPLARVLIGYCFVGSIALFVIFTDALPGSDALGYYAQVERYSSLASFFTFIIDVVKEQWLLASAFLSFPILYLPFYGFYGLENADSIAALNAALWLLTALMIAGAAHRYLQPRHADIPIGLAFALTLLSPAALYLASTFGKDTAATFLCVLVLLCALRKRYIAAVLLLYLATMLRPYSVGIVALYLLIFRAPLRVIAATAVAAVILVIALAEFRPIVGVNILLIEGFFFFSPNPLDAENWEGVVSVLALEGVFFGLIGLISVAVFLAVPRSRALYVRLLLSLAVYAAIMALVGYVHMKNHGVLYGLGSAGDNIVRKKLPVMPVLAMYAATTLRSVGIFVRRCMVPRQHFVAADFVVCTPVSTSTKLGPVGTAPAGTFST